MGIDFMGTKVQGMGVLIIKRDCCSTHSNRSKGSIWQVEVRSSVLYLSPSMHIFFSFTRR
jgi:hypothetical protein